jgi:hypothetical protein
VPPKTRSSAVSGAVEAVEDTLALSGWYARPVGASAGQAESTPGPARCAGGFPYAIGSNYARRETPRI